MSKDMMEKFPTTKNNTQVFFRRKKRKCPLIRKSIELRITKNYTSLSAILSESKK